MLKKMLILFGLCGCMMLSACSSETPKPSAVLTAMGFSARESYSALRVSFFDDTTEEDVLIFANTLREVLKNY